MGWISWDFLRQKAIRFGLVFFGKQTGSRPLVMVKFSILKGSREAGRICVEANFWLDYEWDYTCPLIGCGCVWPVNTKAIQFIRTWASSIVGSFENSTVCFQEGRLPLHYAGALRSELCYSLLLEHGADEMKMDGRGFGMKVFNFMKLQLKATLHWTTKRSLVSLIWHRFIVHKLHK
jgi:hypothetical protein